MVDWLAISLPSASYDKFVSIVFFLTMHKKGKSDHAFKLEFKQYTIQVDYNSKFEEGTPARL